MTGDLATLGWQRFGFDPEIAAWAGAAREMALPALSDPEQSAQWRCGGTWFVGVDALKNAADGRVANVPLNGVPIRHLREAGALPDKLHKAQVSVTRPGYPRPGAEESAAAAQFRRARDGAHVDGLLPIGPERRRMLKEPHGFILGLPLNSCDPGASPLVVWEGSHKIIGEAFARAFSGMPPEKWGDCDVTDIYQAARRACFDTCRRVALPAKPGEALLLHRMVLHGVAPWDVGATAPQEGRMMAYFRPMISHETWLGAP